MERDEWAKHVEAQLRSGQSVAMYCREQGISESSFRYRKERAGNFVQVSGREPIEVSLRSGAIVRCSATQLGSVLKVIGEA